MKHRHLLALSLLAPLPLCAQDADLPAPEQVVVVGTRVYPVVDTVSPSVRDAVDTAELLSQLPGANFNANGTLSGLAQYRGLHGDRVAVSLDGLGTVTGGPNAMDAPLSYASPLLLAHLSLERGIASVSSAVESIGGHIDAAYDRGRYGEQRAFAFDGKAQGRYASNGSLVSTAARLVGSNHNHKLALLAESDRADDLHYPGGTLSPTRLERDRYDLSYGWQDGDAHALVYLGRLDTSDTGTPALPMDIRSIATDMAGIRAGLPIADRTQLELAFAHSSVDHVMDNYGLRTPPASPMDYRSTLAVGDGYQWRLGTETELAGAAWRFGMDGQTSSHTATITNPNVPPFAVDNFNDAERDIVGVYAQWNREQGPFDVEAGVRVNAVQTRSGPVTAMIPAMNPQMQMMAANAALLAAAFNTSDLERSYTNVDAVLKLGRILGDMRSVYVELGRKTRAPAYQELFLWLPLQSTGGLADGRSYIGDPAVRPEVSNELNLGTNWRWQRAWLAPQLFFKRIDDYIQGVPSTSAVANMVSMMMSGAPALAFANTDAEIRGLDLAWGIDLTDAIGIDGLLTYARGKRRDVDDNLYRLVPLNGRIGISYARDDWSVRVEAVAYAAQNDVAAYNAEPRTPGYGIVNARLNWRPIDGLSLSASVLNLADREYRDHLDGINRVTGVDVPLGERLYGAGRSVQLGVSYEW